MISRQQGEDDGRSDVEADSTSRPSFPEQATETLQNLRAALAAIVDSVPTRVGRPAELQRALKIDFKLSCKVLKVIKAERPLATGPHVPGASALRTFLNAASKAGVSEQLVGRAAEAAEAFDQLVAVHAGDRTSFDSMISALAATGDAKQITMHHRRAAFRAQGHILGLQAGVQLKCLAIQPARDDPAMLDLARITGFLSLRQLRSNAPLIVPGVSVANDDGSVRRANREPLDPEVDEESGVCLVRDYCSQPLPRFRSVEPEPGNAYGELVSQGLGIGAALDFVEGHIVRAAVPRYQDEKNKWGADFARVRIPCEVLLIDLLVHESTYGVLSPTSYARAEHYGELPYLRIMDESLQLSPRPTVSNIGKGCSALYSPDVPRYAELGSHVAERLGADPGEFEVYRCRVEYPVLPSTVAVTFALPEAPA